MVAVFDLYLVFLYNEVERRKASRCFSAIGAVANVTVPTAEELGIIDCDMNRTTKTASLQAARETDPIRLIWVTSRLLHLDNEASFDCLEIPMGWCWQERLL